MTPILLIFLGVSPTTGHCHGPLELLIGDNPMPTNHSSIMKASEEYMPWEVIEHQIRAREATLQFNDVGVARYVMQNLMAGYVPSSEIVD